LVRPDLFFDAEAHCFLVVVVESLAVGEVPDEDLLCWEAVGVSGGCGFGERGDEGWEKEKEQDAGEGNEERE
jgi:hypothetical protein